MSSSSKRAKSVPDNNSLQSDNVTTTVQEYVAPSETVDAKQTKDMYMKLHLNYEKVWITLDGYWNHETVLNVKERLQTLLNREVSTLRLSLGSKVLCNNKNLAHYGIASGSVLQLYVISNPIQVFVRLLTGNCITVDIGLNETVLQLKELVHAREGIHVDQQRFICNSRQLEDKQTMEECGIKNGFTVHLVLRLRGMISSFVSNDATDPTIKYLLNDAKGYCDLDALYRTYNLEEYHGITLNTAFKLRECEALSAVQLKLLSDFIGYYASLPPRKSMVDIKLVVSPTMMKQLLSLVDDFKELAKPDSNLAVSELLALHPNEHAKLAFRYTRGPTNGCIKWHFDGAYATHTTQIALNSPKEYEGGQLCFLTSDYGVVFPYRPVGFLTQHGKNVLHAVTALRRGERKSLFVLDEANGLGDADVLQMSQGDLDMFIYNKWRVIKRQMKA